MDGYFVGTEIKLALTITCEGFDMDNDNWIATIKKGARTPIVCDKEHNTAYDQSEGKWYLLIDTTLLGNGIYYLVVDIDVPDIDFPDGLRHETYKQQLFTVNGV